MSVGSLDSLSVDAIAAEKGGFDKEKLKAQAANNVARQQFAKGMRNDDRPPGPSSKAAASQKKETKPALSAEDEQLEIANLIQKVTEFKRNPFLAQKLTGVAMPRSGTLAEWKVTYKQCKDALGQGVGEMSLRQGYCMLMPFLCNALASDSVPPKVRLPPGGDQFMSQIICHPEVEKRAFNEEFAELAIEYAHLFRSGPISRLVFGTLTALFSYKQLVESGVMNPGTFPSAPETPTVAEPTRQHPAPMHVYPQPNEYQQGQIDPMPSSSGDVSSLFAATSTAASSGYPTPASSEPVTIKIEPTKKPVRGGRKGI